MSRFKLKVIDNNQPELALEPRPDHDRPLWREECRGGPRPCPIVGCEFSTYLGVDGDTGAIEYYHLRPDRTPMDVDEAYADGRASCYADLIEEYPEGVPLEIGAAAFGVNFQRASALEQAALAARPLRRLKEFVDE